MVMRKFGRWIKRLWRKKPLGPAIAIALVLIGALIAAQYWQGQKEKDRAIATSLTGGDPDRAPVLIRRFGCGGCHAISGVAGADGKVAPPLDNFRKRVYVAGVLRNSPENLIQWIVAPQKISPQSAMPATGITPDDARHVAAYLYAN
jgi:mono/diheme cytochrome c family protein